MVLFSPILSKVADGRLQSFFNGLVFDLLGDVFRPLLQEQGKQHLPGLLVDGVVRKCGDVIDQLAVQFLVAMPQLLSPAGLHQITSKIKLTIT